MMRMFFLIALALVFAANTMGVHAQDKTVLNVFIDGDTNISDWWLKTIIPAFTKANPQYAVIVSVTRGAGGNDLIAQRALAALQTNSDPQVDYFEEYETFNHPDLEQAGLFLELNEQNVPNSKNIIKAAQRSKYDIAYRGSQVLLAYNSDKVPEAEVPQTFADLLAWIKAHPGEFVYCRPDKGGSGGNFVVRAIYEANGKDPSMFNADKYDQATVQKQMDKAWALLRDIHPAIYDNGSYPAGNTPVLKLLANESVSMASVWSDQAIQALAQGTLPANIKLTQLKDLPFPGGYAYGSIPKNSRHVEGALLLANFLLSPEMQTSVVKDIGGFPSVSWDVLPKELQSQFTSVITDTVPLWPGGKFDTDRNKGWYEQVATNIDPNSP